MNPDAMNPDDQKKTDQRFAELFASIDSSPAAPDEAFLDRLREQSARAFTAQLPEPTKHSPPRPSRRRNPMIIWTYRVAAVAVAMIAMVSLLTIRSSDLPPDAFGKVLDQIAQAKTVQLSVAVGEKITKVWMCGADRIRWDFGEGRYNIARGPQLWEVDEEDNRATPKPFSFKQMFGAGLDLLCFLQISDYQPGAAAKTIRTARPAETVRRDGIACQVYRMDLPVANENVQLEALVEADSRRLRWLTACTIEKGRRRPLGKLTLEATDKEVPEELFVVGDKLTRDGRIGKVTDFQGLVALKPVMHARWTPVAGRVLLRPVDWLRTDVRGANAVAARLAPETDVTLGPGSLVELLKPDKLRIFSGEIKLVASKKHPVELLGPGDAKIIVQETKLFRLDGEKLVALKKPPAWLQGFEGATSKESLGSLIAKVDGRNVPLSVGYHKVTVDIRDQIARTVIEESFVNHTNEQTEGVFYFPLPQDASISGFGMWIGGKLIEADVVEKQRAREIYETLRRERRDPGLLEWTGGNIFKARVFPIFPHSEKRVKITYTQVLPLRGNQYRYSYALQSEMLKQHLLRELDLNVTIHSATPLKEVGSPTHTTRTRKTKHSARVEFSAQEYTPTSDFEVIAQLAHPISSVVMIPHRRGEDGYFMLQVTPPAGAAEQSRDVLPDGEPLELLILADTSGSMDENSRRNQAEIIAAILGALTPNDRVNLAVCDVDCQWAFEKPVAVDAENIAAARQFLADRGSLGWTDLDRAFASALKQAGPKTHVLYVGDGIVTGRDSDPVRFGNRLKRLYQGKAATCHAVAVSSSYEPAVLRAIAAQGGGSVRNLSNTSDTSALAGELLAEMIRPSLRDLRVAFRGLQVARVYPEVLPNLAPGSQQILLGRYLPEGRDQSGEVVVTGMKGNEKVHFSTGVSLADAESGNSFIPRLWARMYLDYLLQQGATSVIRDDIIALSEQYHIITPYTSLLVLETDADRERFKVRRRFGMRDGERFWGKGRDEAYYALVQQQMRQAGNWRIGLRRSILAELAGLGRDAAWPRFDSLRLLVLPQVASKPEAPCDYENPFVGDLKESAEDTLWKADRNVPLGTEESTNFADNAPPPMCLPPMSPMASVDVDADLCKEAKYKVSQASPASCRRVDRFRYRDSRWGIRYAGWLDTLFPPLPPAATSAKRKPPKKPWPDAARKLAESLLRNAALAKIEGGLVIRRRTERFDTRYDELTSRHDALALYSPKAWLTRSGGNGAQTIIHWCDENQRGALSKAFLLGRLRPSVPEDLRRPPLGLAGYVQNSLEQAYQEQSVTLKPQGEDRMLLVLQHPEQKGNAVHVLIDTAREVILRIESHQDDKVTSTTAFDGFVHVAGTWFAGRITTTDKGQDLKTVITQQFEPLVSEDFEEQFARELAGREQVQFIRAPLPKRGVSKRAIAQGKAAFDDHLALVLHFSATQQWGRAMEHLRQAEKLSDGKPGRRWIRDAMLQESRRREELKNQVLDEIARLAVQPTDETDRNEELFLANYLYDQAKRICEANEMLDLLDVLEPIYRRQPPFLKTMKRWTQWRLDHLHHAGQTEQVFRLRKQLAMQYPHDCSLQEQYAHALAGRGEHEAAYAWLDRVLKENTKWREHEENNLRRTYADLLQRQGRCSDLVDYMAAWVEQNPTSAWVYERCLGALIRNQQQEKAFDLMRTWFKEGHKPDKLDPAVLARLYAAVNQALGEGCDVNANQIESGWLDPLAELVWFFARHEFHAGVAEHIMERNHFRESDQGRQIREKVRELLLAEPDTHPVDQIERFVKWIRSGDPAVGPPTWKRIADGLEKRWSDETDPIAKHRIGDVIRHILWYCPSAEDCIAFLRRQVEEGPREHRADYADRLWFFLYGQPWTLEHEDEMFSLLEKLSDAEEPAERLRAQVESLLKMTKGRIQDRFDARMKKVKNQHRLSRTELREKQEENLRLAQSAYADRLAVQTENHPAELARWINLERLYLNTLLGRDLEEVEQQCWEYLGTKPQTCPGTDEEEPSLEEVFQNRCLVTLSNLAARRGTKPDLLERLLKYIDMGIALDKMSNYWKYAKYRLLVAMDRPEELEQELRDWIRIDDADSYWRRSLGYLLGEQGKIAEAIGQFEAIQRDDELGPAEYRTLADWYMVVDRRKEYEEARMAVYETCDEGSLAHWAHEQLSILDGRRPNLPRELHRDAPIVFAVLFEKSGNPEHHAGRLMELYQRTRDFRLLEGLPESVLGHTSRKIYPFLKSLRHVAREIRKEAVVDQIVERIHRARGQAKTAVDRRALDLLEAMVERRAAELLNQPGPHTQRAVEALQRAFKYQWSRGEPWLMADYLSSMKTIPYPKLAEEQRCQARLLHEEAAPGSIDRLHIARQRARILWDYGQRQKAIDLLAAALDEFQNARDGILPKEANGPLDVLVEYLGCRGHFARAEKIFQEHLAHPVNQQQRYWLTERLYQMYDMALRDGGQISLGAGPELYKAAQKVIQADLETPDHDHRYRLLQRLCSIYRTVHEKKIANIRDDLTAFATKKLPEVLRRQTNHYQSIVREVAQTVHDLLGPRDGLAVLIERIENEPKWFRLSKENSWDQFGDQLVQWRVKVKNLGDLENRLLTIILDALRRDLKIRRFEDYHYRNSLRTAMYWRMHRHKKEKFFWEEKSDDFARVADEVLAAGQQSNQMVRYIARYFWDGLCYNDRAIEILLDAHRREVLDNDGLSELVDYLHCRNRLGESIAILELLIRREPDRMRHRTRLMHAYFHTQKPDVLQSLLEKTDAHFHKGERWRENEIAQLAAACLETQLYAQAVQYYEELIPLRQRDHQHHGGNDGTLSGYYNWQARAYMSLKKTSEAVEAACGAIVCWGPDHSQRQGALDVLTDVLRKSPDLDAYVVQLDEKTDEEGVDNPIVRRAIGQVYAEKKEYAKAIAQLKLAVALQPDDTEIRKALIACYDEQNDKPGAVKELLDALQLIRRDIKLYEDLGQRFTALERPKQAERAYTSIVEMLPSESESHALLAEIRQKQDRWPEAIVHWKEVARIRSLEPTGLLRLAEAQIHLKQWDEARQTVRRLTERDWPYRFGNVHAQARQLRQKIDKHRKP